MNRKVLPGIFVACSTFALGQSIPAKEIETKSNIAAAYLDRPGDFYSVDEDGTITKYTIDGEEIAKAKFNNHSIFDPWYGINVLVHSKNENFYTIVDRNLENPKRFAIDSAFAIEPSLVCISNERNIWVLDKADMSLKRINKIVGRVEAESIIPDSVVQGRSFIFMREYQNFLFLQDSSGNISVFNQLGIYLRDIKLPAAKQFNFLGEELYFVDDGRIRFFDLFDTRTREIPIDKDARHVLLTDTRMVVVYINRIVVRPNNP